MAETLASQKGHRWFAALYDRVSGRAERRVLSQLRPFVTGEATGHVLEIGVGTGANLPYYRVAEKIVGTEPDPFMLSRAKKRTAQLGLSVEFHQCPAEALPFPGASFDTVVATLVLCTVDDPARSLAEIRRVLKPNGTFCFMEHVRADGRALGRLTLVVEIGDERRVVSALECVTHMRFAMRGPSTLVVAPL